ncbi:MAG: hydratase [Alphaproteobacteria bacterium]|nr:hydratase [Alphaproteobacteria bacterium]
MSPEAHGRAAALLAAARARRRPLPGLPPDCRPETLADAYAIQNLVVKGLGAPVGWKVGATSQGAQKLLATDEPFRGRLIEGHCHRSPATLSRADFFLGIVEIEHAFRMARDLPPLGAPYDAAAVVTAVEAHLPAFEIIDSRYTEWTTRGALQLIADNGVGGSFVMGEPWRGWRHVDLARHPVAIVRNGSQVSVGSGERVLGHPLKSLAWLANDLASSGLGLRAGDIVTTGSCADIIAAEAEDLFVGDFGTLGRVELRFDA